MVCRHHLPGQTRFHTTDESDTRRKTFITDCVRSGLVRVWIYVAPFPAKEARLAIIDALATDAAKHNAGRLVIERGDPVRDLLDRRAIARALRAASADIAYSHERPGSYAGLEIADAAAWMYGAGGRWRDLVAPIVDQVRDLTP